MTALDALPAVETDADHRVQLEAVYWSFAGISTIFIGLRVWDRVTRGMAGKDDWLMVACWLSFIVTGAILTLIAETGGTRHKVALTVPELEFQIKLQTINLIFWIATTLFGKLAIGFTILRILDRTNKWHTWPVYIVMHLMSITCLLDTCFVLFQCGNPENLWNLREPSRCLDEGMVYKFNIFTTAWQVFMNFFLAFFPMCIIWKLQMESLRRKYTIMTLLGLPTFTGVAASVKTAVSPVRFGEAAQDSTWDIYVLSMCTATEIMLLIVFGSVPVMVPVWDKFVKSCRQIYASASGGKSSAVKSSGGGHSKPVWSKEAEPPQPKQSIETADLETIDLEESRLMKVSPIACLADLPSMSQKRESSLQYGFASKQCMVDRLPRRWHMGEKRWRRVEGEGASERHCGDSAV